MGWVVLGIIVVLVIWAIAIYNGLVALRNQFKNAFAQIDVQLKRRYDLIPNLVETAKGYIKHERETLEAVIAARSAAMSGLSAAKASPGDPAAMAQLASSQGMLNGALGRLMAVAEAYPDLKADDNFRQLQGELSEIEEQLQSARRYYNATVRDLNTSIQSFPNVLFARPFGFAEAEFYADADASIQQAPKVQFGAAKP